jgi:hypothetical protein
MAFQNQTTPAFVGDTGFVNQKFTGNPFYDWAGKPDWDPTVMMRNSQYVMTQLMSYLTREETTRNTTFNWAERDSRWYQLVSIDAEGTVNAGPNDDTGSFDAVAGPQMFIVNDIILLPSTAAGTTVPRQAIITGVTDNTTYFTYDIQVDSGVMVAATDLPAAGVVAYLTNAFGECSTEPGVRYYQPDQYTGYTQLTRTHYKICDFGAENMMFIGEGSDDNRHWWYKDTTINLTKHQRDVEFQNMFSRQTSYTKNLTGQNDPQTTAGVFTNTRANGIYGEYTTAVDEDQLRDWIKHMCIHGELKKCLVLAGLNFFDNLQRNLKDYVIQGAMNFGNYNAEQMKTVGIPINGYSFLDTVCHVVRYRPFNDPEFAPAGFSNTALFLNIDNLSDGKPSIIPVYKKTDKGRIVKALFTKRSGPRFSESSEVSTFENCLEEDWQTECGLKQRCSHLHGVFTLGS